MPTPENITRPFTLIAPGRSGTSLTMNILKRHADVSAVGETAALLFGVWASTERCKGIIRADHSLADRSDHDARSAKAVRASFLAVFPEPDPAPAHWMMKPINRPWVLGRMKNHPDPYGWYWNALARSFPETKPFTILRHPYDVVLSGADWWQIDQKRAWAGVLWMARLLLHEASPITFAVSHQALVEDPEPEVRRLLDHLGLPHDPACFEATDMAYVVRKGQIPVAVAAEPEVVDRRFARRADWHKIDQSLLKPEDRADLERLWQRFGQTLDLSL